MQSNLFQKAVLWKTVMYLFCFVMTIETAQGKDISFGSDWNTLFGSSYTGSFKCTQNSLTLSGSTDNVTITAVNGTSTSGYVKTEDFRVYNGYTMTITVPDKYSITAISSTKGGSTYTSGITANVGSLSITNSSISWTGSSNSVVFTMTGTVSFATITVTVKQTTTTTFSGKDSYVAKISESFTAPTATNSANGTIAYSSSSTDVATVNAETGAVTLVGTGTATITASYAGDADYAPSSDSYTLTVINALQSYSVTFQDYGKEAVVVTETEAGAGVVPVETSAIGDYSFAGWSNTQITDETTTTPEFIELTDGRYYPSENTTLYAIYTKVKNTNQQGMILSVTKDDITYYLAPRSGSNKFFDATDDKTSALTIFQDGQHLYYMSGTTKYYFYNNSSTELTFQTTKAEANLWTIANSDNTANFYNETTSRYLAFNSNRFAAYVDKSSYPHDLTVEQSSEYVQVSLPHYTSTPSAVLTPSITFESSSVSIDALDAEGNRNTYTQTAITTSNGEVSYSSSDESIATVDSEGKVSVVKGGEVTITATVAAVENVWNEACTSYVLTISKMTPTIVFESGSRTVYKDNSITVKATSYEGAKIIYDSSKPSWATVTEEGVVTGVANDWNTSGIRYVTIYAGLEESDLYTAITGTSRAKISITVKNNVKTQPLAFANASYRFTYGEAVDNFTNALTGAVTAVTYTSDNDLVAEVNATTGEVTLHSSAGGVAIITATTEANDNVIENGIRYNYEQAEASYVITNVCESNLSLIARTESNYYATYSSSKVTFFKSSEASVHTINVSDGKIAMAELATETGIDDAEGYFVPANTGVLIISANSNEGVGKSISYYTYEGKAVTTPDNNLLLPGQGTTTTAPAEGSYYFYKLAYNNYTEKSGLGFYWGKNNGAAFTCKSGTAYLAVPTSTIDNASEVRGFSFDAIEGENATGLTLLDAASRTSIITNLSGQRINKITQSGLYIVNGKIQWVNAR